MSVYRSRYARPRKNPQPPGRAGRVAARRARRLAAKAPAVAVTPSRKPRPILCAFAEGGGCKAPFWTVEAFDGPWAGLKTGACDAHADRAFAWVAACGRASTVKASADGGVTWVTFGQRHPELRASGVA